MNLPPLAADKISNKAEQMRHWAKTLWIVIFVGIVAVLGITGASRIKNIENLEKFTGLHGVTRSLEAIRLRSAHPTMDPEVLAQRAEEGATRKGLIGVLAGMNKRDVGPAPAATVPAVAPAIPGAQPSLETAVVPQAQAATGQPSAQPGAGTPIEATGRVIQLQDAQDGHQVYGVIHAAGVDDFNAIERINALNISEELRDKILRNYQATGVLPEIIKGEKRKPAATSAPAAGEEL